MLTGDHLWNETIGKLNGSIKNMTAKEKSNIVDKLYKKISNLCVEKSLSLPYNKYGTQLFELNSNISNIYTIKKNGFSLMFVKNYKNLKKI